MASVARAVPEEVVVSVLIVYGAVDGPARAPAVRLARALRTLGIDGQVRHAGRVARMGRPAAIVLAVDAPGRAEIEELIDSFHLTGDPTPLYGVRADATSLPPGVRPLAGTRRDGAAPIDAGGPLRLASALTAGLRQRSVPPFP